MKKLINNPNKTSLMMNYRIIIIMIMTIFVSGCFCFHMSWTGKPYRIAIHFHSETSINQEILLPVHVITVEQPNEILEMGPENWFKNHKKRNALFNNVQQLAISSSQSANVYVYLDKNIEKIIIYADYEGIYERNPQEIIITPRRFRLNYNVALKSNKMELIQ